MKRMITISLGLAMFGAAAGPALGQFDCVFNTSEGDWSVPGNWLYCDSGVPGAGDTAIIPSGKTCTIQDRARSAGSITIEEGGELIIGNARSLTLLADSTIDGTLRFESSGSKLLFNDDLTLGSPGESGEIVAESDLAGLVSWPGSLGVVTIGEKLTVRGNIAVLTHLVNNGKFIVGDADDRMFIGWDNQYYGSWPITVAGSGTFDVKTGELIVGWVSEFGPGEPKWRLDGGLVHIMDVCSGCADITGNFFITGAKLDVDEDLCTEGTLTFSAGTIDVDDEVYAAFSAASCPL